MLLAPAGFREEWSLAIGAFLTPSIVAPLLPYLVPRWSISLVLHFAYGRLYRPTTRDIDEYWAPSQFPGFTRAMWELLHTFDWGAGTDHGFELITAPTVVMDGSRDHLVVKRWVKRYVAILRHAIYDEVKDCGHVVPEEAPERVARAVAALIG